MLILSMVNDVLEVAAICGGCVMLILKPFFHLYIYIYITLFYLNRNLFSLILLIW
jgi:hypothetical protein